jgi:hypothetical protein
MKTNGLESEGLLKKKERKKKKEREKQKPEFTLKNTIDKNVKSLHTHRRKKPGK